MDLEKRKYLLSTLNQLKRIKKYEDEIPKETIHSVSKDAKYKCRKGFWTVLQIRLSDMNRENLLPREIIQQYIKTFEEYNKHKKVTPQDIIRANNLIDLVVSDIKKELEPKMLPKEF